MVGSSLQILPGYGAGAISLTLCGQGFQPWRELTLIREDLAEISFRFRMPQGGSVETGNGAVQVESFGTSILL
jgi:hypothetical protein